MFLHAVVQQTWRQALIPTGATDAAGTAESATLAGHGAIGDLRLGEKRDAPPRDTQQAERQPDPAGEDRNGIEMPRWLRQAVAPLPPDAREAWARWWWVGA